MKYNFGALSFSHRKLKHEKREDFAGSVHGYALLNLWDDAESRENKITNVAVKNCLQLDQTEANKLEPISQAAVVAKYL